MAKYKIYSCVDTEKLLFEGDNLVEANLEGAYLCRANLEGAKGIEQLNIRRYENEYKRY